MLKYIAETIDGDLINLGSPFEVTINKSLDAPSDDLEVTFPVTKKLPEIKSVSVCNEKKEKVFFGFLDVQKFFYKTSGSYCNLILRSRVSLLLDNEAQPQSYLLPSLEIIFNRHVKPYGFNNFLGINKPFSKEFIVTKGMSEWEVLERFCKNYLGTYPKFLNDDTLDASGKNINKESLFSNEVKNSIKYSSICENIKRYKMYSELRIKAGEDTMYSLVLKNKEAINRGILRKRYLNISGNNNEEPIAYGEKILSTSNKNAFEIIISCPGNINLNIGDVAKIKDSAFKSINGEFLVFKTQYILNKNGEKTVVTLIKKAVK